MRVTRREFAALAAALPLSVTAQPRRWRRRRKDCFFGIHFDLHPRLDDEALGRDVTPEMVEKFLDRVRPDFVQYDYKGHVGVIGYPSKVSAHAPIVKDSLRIWREATARRGIPLYIHFSGLLDEQAVKDHPEWARVGPDGERSKRETSPFSPYVTKRMIPQLKEAIRNYAIDGAWVDGECWGVHPDYGEKAARAFEEETGIYPPPKKPGEPGWQEWLEFGRRRFRAYLKRYLDAIHAFRPGFEITSNWMYTTLVPERPELPIDFISGDYLGNAPISRARLEARYLSSVGKTWDLMAWGFQSARSNPVGPVHKSSVQLMQEAAVVLAQGGGFQIYYQPTRAGHVDDRHIAVMARVARFCRSRQALCHESETVPAIGVLFSGYSLYHTAGKLFGGWGKHEHPVRGMVDALVDAALPVDVIPDWKLEEVMRDYPMIVVPDWPEIGEAAQTALRDYARAGGTLLLAGAENARAFAGELQVRLEGEPEETSAFLPGREVFADMSGVWQAVEPEGARALARRHPTYDGTREAAVAATAAAFGDGTIAAIYGPAGTVYAETHAPEVRNVLNRIVRAIYEPPVEVEAPPVVEIALRRQAGVNVLHLLNAAGMQVAANYSAIDFVPPLRGIGVRIRMEQPPARAAWEPGGRPAKGEWKDGWWRTRLERLDIHQMLVWEA